MTDFNSRGPERIICLTTETVDVLYRLGQSERIAGISGFTVHPPRARREKPRVAAFSTAHIDRILALDPDLILAFSDIQADLVAELVRAGARVHVFNQRSVTGILEMVLDLGRLVDALPAARELVGELDAHIDRVAEAGAFLGSRPRVYFEEWDEPMICGIQWVSEMIALAGGEDIFSERARHGDARSRILADSSAIIERQPELMIGSWCGKKFRPDRVAARAGWETIPAVVNGQLREIKSADILQPGPTALTRGLSQLQTLIVEAPRSSLTDRRRHPGSRA